MENNDIENEQEETQRKQRSLSDALVRAKSRQADRDDVVVEMKEAEAARLELLAQELRPLMSEIDETDERFDFAMTRGERPRLWIDMTSFVAMGHDKRSYRFLKDTRMGRVVLAESTDMDKMADIVSDYVAERVLERERQIEGEWIAAGNEPAPADKPLPTNTSASAPASPAKSGWRSFWWFLFGVILCAAAMIAGFFLVMPTAL
ncbi:MAG: hypothetical protein AAGF28_04265 [Pseudomonadota bacterium]